MHASFKSHGSWFIGAGQSHAVGLQNKLYINPRWLAGRGMRMVQFQCFKNSEKFSEGRTSTSSDFRRTPLLGAGVSPLPAESPRHSSRVARIGPLGQHHASQWASPPRYDMAFYWPLVECRSQSSTGVVQKVRDKEKGATVYTVTP
jgi:hypothetical protein